MVANNGNGHRKVPAKQGKVGYCNPPVETRFKPGESGNPAGRPSAGASVREWWNQMQEWSRTKLESVIADKDAPVNKVAAAQAWLSGCKSGNDLDRILDRTDGKTPLRVANADGSNIELAPLVLDGERQL